MEELFLVTTALEDTWPEPNKPVLFLGEWCKLYSRKDCWKKIASKTVPYHWDDRDKLYKDYQYLVQLYEVLLTELTTELNKIHRVSYSTRYWTIVIGPWLMMFLPALFDRWKCLDMAIATYPITNTKIHKEINLNYVPQCMVHFLDISQSDLWNHAIYSSILKFLNFEKKSFIKINKQIPKRKVYKNNNSRIKYMIKFCSSFLSRNNDYFLKGTYLSKIDSVKLHLKLGQIPVYYDETYSSEISTDKNFRNMSLSGFKSITPFEEFVKKVIPLQIPIAYLEGYKELIDRTKNLRWPKTPKLIWTSNSFLMDEIFKFWSAEKVEKGIPLVIGQHGGHYGQGLFNISEHHELKICDHYLSWGWGGGEIEKVIPVGSVKRPIINKKEALNNKPILLLISATSMYSSGMASMPVSGQWIEYFDYQMEFYENLPKNISSNVLIRLYQKDANWSQYARWKDRFPESKVNEGEEPFNKVLKNTKLFVSGWNTTTYLESMLSNVPTVIFWNPEHFEIRDNAKNLFEKLKKVGILHDDPISAAKHVLDIYNDIDSWWNRPDVLSARTQFTNKYAYSNNVLNKLSCIFKDISNKRHLI